MNRNVRLRATYHIGPEVESINPACILTKIGVFGPLTRPFFWTGCATTEVEMDKNTPFLLAF
jgi:hypothetical protein